MERVFFKSDTLESVATTPDGKIDFRAVGRRFGLEPDSIRLCDDTFPTNDVLWSVASWTQIKNFLGVAGTKEDPVMVSGRPISEAPTGLSSGVPERLLQDLTEYLAEQKAKQKSKKSVCLSSVSQSIWDNLQQQEGLKMTFKDIDSKPKRLSDLPAFGWEDRLEKSQADRYIPHLSNIKSGRAWKLIDAANHHPILLSGLYGGWSFKGTTDVAFVHRKAGKISYRSGLKCIFELKKELSEGGCQKALIQIVICLVMANVFARQFKPFAVLTDLDNTWSLFWMDGSTIFWSTFESRASAVGYIEELLEDSDGDEMGTSEALASYVHPHGENEDLRFIKKRRMYEPPEMDNLKELVGSLPDEEILSARAQIGVQQLQKLLHIPSFSGVPDVDMPWPSHIYS